MRPPHWLLLLLALPIATPAASPEIRRLDGSLQEALKKSAATEVHSVEVTATGDLAEVREAIAALPGVTVDASAAGVGYGVVSARVPAAQLLALTEIEGVVAVQAVRPNAVFAPAKGTKATGNYAADLMRVDRLRAYFPHADGRGIRVGVVSDSANRVDTFPNDGRIGIAESQASGDLPDNGRIQIVEDGVAGIDMGRAMMEHIYDIAPGVDRLAFATGGGGGANMAENIGLLSNAAGMDIICDGYSYQDEPIYQDGIIAQAVSDHTNRGLYFAKAGNSGNLSFEDVWRDTNGNDFHEFSDSGSELDPLVLQPGQTMELNIFWAEPWGRANRDLDLVITDANGRTIYGESTTDSSVTRLPYDHISITNSSLLDETPINVKVRNDVGGMAGVRFKIVAGEFNTRLGGMIYWREVFDSGTSSYIGIGAGAIVPHAGTLRAMAVGAAYDNSRFEAYTSQGPYRQLFDVAGDPADQTMQKPDFVAMDSGRTSFLNSRNGGFEDTSAAAANAAGVAALILQLKGGPDSMTQAQMRSFLRLTSRSNPPLSHNNIWGFGQIDALGSGLAAAGAQPATASLIPNQFGDINREIPVASDSTLLSLRFPHFGNDYISSRVTGQGDPTFDHPVGEAFSPVQVIFDDSTSPFRTIAYPAFAYQKPPISNASFTALSPIVTLEVASDFHFTGANIARLEIDGPSFPLQPYTPSPEGEVYGSISPANPIVYYEVLLPDDGGPGFTVEASSLDADIVLAVFEGRGALIQEASGAAASGVTPFADSGFILAVTTRNFAGAGDYTLRVNYESLPGLPRTTEFGDISNEIIPNPVTGIGRGFGNLGPAPERDVWAIRTGGGTLAAEVTGIFPSTGLLSLGVYTKDQTRLTGIASTLLPTITAPTAAGEPYYVVSSNVTPSDGAVYDVRVTVTPPTPQELTLLPDRDRGEYFRGLFNGELAGIGDAQTFRFVNPPLASGPVYVAVDNRDFIDLELDPAMQLFDAAGVAVTDLVNETGPGGGEAVTVNLVPGATYFLQVFGRPHPFSNIGDAALSGPFRVDVRSYTSGIVTEPEEPNNNIAEALDLGELAGVWTDAKFAPFTQTDADFFRVVVQRDENSLFVQLRNQSPAKGLATAPPFNLRDRDGNLRASSEQVGDEQQIAARGLEEGDYFIEVPGNNSGTTYALRWEASTTAEETWTIF